MQYALVNGVRTEPIKGLHGVCEGCHRETISKCGNIKVHHWAHKDTKECDSWWEPETEWHREWKNHFPETFREVVFRDERTDEVHRADIHTSRGVTIEFQNSPISIDERKSREAFYEKLIWVVNAKDFEITPTRNIPDPTSSLLADFEFICDKNGFGTHLSFYRKRGQRLDAKSHYMHEIVGIDHYDLRGAEQLLDDTWGRFVMFTWKYARKAWLTTNTPIFLDFGYPDNIYWLRTRPQDIHPLKYLQVVKKSNFIHKYWQEG